MEGRIPTRLAAHEGRKFGRTVGFAFAVFGSVVMWRDHPLSAQIFWAIGAFLLAGSIVAPAKLKSIEKAWMAMAHQVSRVTTPIVMGITFFLVLTPIGIVVRLVKGNPMIHSVGENGYWHDRQSTPNRETNTSMQRQF